MAQYTEVRLISDLSGDVASQTVRFALDGKQYEVDLTTDEGNRLHRALAPYVGAARKAGSVAKVKAPSTRGQNSDPDGRYHTRIEAEKIREWARSNGIEVAVRGRISSAVLKQYEDRDNFTPPPPVTDEEIVRWVRGNKDTLGITVVAGKCTKRMREAYSIEFPHKQLAYNLLSSVA